MNCLARVVRLVLLVVLASGVHAQDVEYERALRLAESGDPEAVRAFRAVLALDPAYVGAEGSAALGLGSVLRETDLPGAVAAWADGRAALAEAGLVDLALEEALMLVAPLLRDDAASALAADAYRAWVTDAPEDRLAPHVNAAAGVANPDEALFHRPGPVDRTGLLGWWEAQDPVLATGRNERLEEHLARVALAHDRYDALGPELYDDRGEVLVRFGAPEVEDVIRLDGPEFNRNAASRVVAFTPSEIPENELWAYPSLGSAATFLFVQRADGSYRLGTPEALVPRSMRTGLGRSERGRAKSQGLLFALDAIYRQLVRYDPRYYGPAQGVVDYTTTLDFEARDRALDVSSVQSGSQLEVASLGAETAEESLRSTLNQPPDVFAGGALATLAATAAAAAAERETDLPPAQTAAVVAPSTLPAAVRTARFLTPTGETRVEVDWAVDLKALGPARQDSFYLSFAAVTSRPEGGALERHRSDALLTDVGERFPAQSYALVWPSGAEALLCQWVLHPASVRGGRVTTEAAVAANAARIDDLNPLVPMGFQVSDLRPIESVDAAPYPFVRAIPGTPLSLYFEIYGLDNERGQFTVDYTVTQRRGGGILRRGRQESEDGRLVSRAVGGRSAQYLILETSRWSGADEVEIEVTVTSRRGERHVRSVRFDITE